jgi:hypothetical protein
VASFSLARLDDHLDRRLTELSARGGSEGEREESLRRRSGVALAKLAHAQFRAAIAADRFLLLAERGARPQRLMWSTGASGEGGPDPATTLAELAGAETVLSVPLEALPLGPWRGEDDAAVDRDLCAHATLGRSRPRYLLSAVSDFLENEAWRGLRRPSARSVRPSAGASSLRREIVGLAAVLPEVIARLGAGSIRQRLWRIRHYGWIPSARVMR